MATNFPGSLDTSTQQPSPSDSDAMDSGIGHATVHTNHSGALIALETKMGTGASNASGASDGHVLTADGSGGSAWEAAGGGGGSPAGSDTQIQFNNGGSFGADSQMQFVAATGLDVSPGTYSGTFGGCALRIKGEGGSEQSGSIYWVDEDGDRMARLGFGNNTATQWGFKTYDSNASGYYEFGSGSAVGLFAYAGGGACLKSIRAELTSGANDTASLGSSSQRFTEVFATNGTINTSDIALKKDIADTTLGLSFIASLRPVEYKWKNGGVRSHQGFIAQEVKTALDATSSSASQQAMWGTHSVKGATTETSMEYVEGKEDLQEVTREVADHQSLRYTELIAPLVKAVQELKTQNEALTARIATLEG